MKYTILISNSRRELIFRADIFSKSKNVFFLSAEEAENERMHLMTALEMKQPGILFRGTILFTQGTIDSLSSPTLVPYKTSIATRNIGLL